ncbi:MAG: hypothetical protein ABFS03_01555 [Chloroflexota bacterium]
MCNHRFGGGLGDRHQQIVSGIITTNYTLDMAAGLAQVLAEGTNTYLYGYGRISQYAANTWTDKQKCAIMCA